MTGASTLTYNERFSIAMSNVKSEFDEVSGFCDYFSARVKVLEAENAKLRELVRDLHKALFTLDIDHCQACPRDNINGPCTKFEVWGSDECSIEEVMRELGIEVE